MLFSRGRWPRFIPTLGVLGLSATTAGCLQEPPPSYSYYELDAAGEVFRVFCRRVAKAAHPLEAGGEEYYPICDGDDAQDPMQPAADEDPMLVALVNRRPQVIDALRQTFGEDRHDGTPLISQAVTYDKDELSTFLSSLVPLYDKPDERIPTSTRDIAQMLDKVTDDQDPTAVNVIDTMSRLSARVGYRPPELVLGALRPILSYEQLDKLADLLLTVLAEGGSAHDQWLNILRAGSLELADAPVPVPDPTTSTLKYALDLLFSEADSLAGNSGPLPVLKRDDKGDAATLPAASGVDPLPTPFLALDRDDMGQARDANTLAVANGQPLYDTIDAEKTILAGVLRETSKLIDRGSMDRSGVENMAHGLKPLLGPYGAQTLKIGQNNYAFQGPDTSKSPLLDFVHATALALQYPESEALLQVLSQLLQSNESEATATVYGGLKINDRAKNHPEAKLNGPNDFWDDVIDAGNQILARPGLIQALIESFTNPVAAEQGPLFADWMTYNDVVTYKGAPITISPPAPYTDQQKADINAPVNQPLMQMVDRSMPDTGMNRSLWQRTMSLINALNGVQVCNKQGAILNVPTNLGIVFTFPLGNAAGYDKCAFIQFDDAVEVYSLALLNKATVTLKDDIAKGLAAVGGATLIVPPIADITEQNSQITGFRDTLTPQSMARFIFAPPNKFINDLFDPLQTKDGVAIKDYEPYALFEMENPDANINGDFFIKLMVPAAAGLGPSLVQAFDEHEIRDMNGKLTQGYMFGNLLSVFHKHWSSKQSGTCGTDLSMANAGCVQSSDPTAHFYSAGSGVVTYEPLLAEAFRDEDYIGILARAATVLKGITCNAPVCMGKSGTQVLSEFVTRMLTADASLKTRSGATHTKTNTCVEMTGPDGNPACTNNVGRIIPQLTPLYMVLDALHEFDDAFAQPDASGLLDIWHAGRSQVVDALLTVNRTGAAGGYTYQLADRNAYAIAITALPWISAQIDRHTQAGDLADWAAGLAGRLQTILKHPLTAGVVDLLDAFWDETDASGEFTKVSATLLDEANNPDQFRGMLVSVADLLTLLHTDQNLSPAIQFASLGMAPNAFDAVGGSDAPDVEHGTLTAGLELARDVIHQQRATLNDPDTQLTTLAKLLRNAVVSDGTMRSPAEVLFDATADVNRTMVTAPTEQTLDSDEDRNVLKNVSLFLFDDKDDQRSLERLYTVIQGRSLKGQ